MMQENIR